MNEREFDTSLRTRFLSRYPGALWYKIPDSQGVDGQKRPFDIFVVSRHTGTIFLETKMHKSLSPFLFSKIEPHQIDSLRIGADNLARSYVVIGVRCLTTKFDRKKIESDISRIWLDIWIPSESFPGKGSDIARKKLNVREIVRDMQMKRNKVNEIYLSKDGFEAYSE